VRGFGILVNSIVSLAGFRVLGFCRGPWRKPLNKRHSLSTGASREGRVQSGCRRFVEKLSTIHATQVKKIVEKLSKSDDVLFIGTRFSNLYSAVDTPA
jgi:hypothetical protein